MLAMRARTHTVRHMKPLYCQILTNAFNYSVGMTKFYTGLARTNRGKPGVHAAQLRAARKHALDARRVWPDLRAAGATLNRRAA